MSRLIAYMGSDPERLRAALTEHHDILRSGPAPTPEETLSNCGVGFYQGGEVLLQRRPRLPAGPVDLLEAVKDLRTDALLAQAVRGVESRQAKSENTPPYRFRSWIMAQQGDAPGLSRPREEVLALIPDFLKRNIRGQTASEQLFHVFLSSLHETGRAQIEDANLPPELALRAFQHALGRLREALGAEAVDSGSLQVALTNGRCLVVLRRGPQPLWLRRLGQGGGTERDRGHDPFRGVLAIAGPGLAPEAAAGFEEVPAEHALLVGRDLVPRVAAL